jgi:hypothetical protein
MTQAPFQSDGLRIEPGSGQTLTILRDAATGSLRFVDTLVPSGINLLDISGFNAITGALVVGRAGTGAKYTTVQSAIDAVSAAASAANPYTIFVLPGVYLENLIIEKDGIAIVALGQVSIVAVTATPTITIQAGVSTTPLTTLFQGIKIQTSNAGLECVLISGGAASTVGSGGIVFKDCNFAALGVGSYTVRADTVNSVALYGCRSDESAVTAVQKAVQCASYLISGGTAPATQLDYTTALPLPATAGSVYSIEDCRTVGNVLSTLTSGGSLGIKGCLTVGNVTLNGNRTGLIQSSTVGNITVGGTSAMTLVSSKRGTAAGAGTLDEPLTGSTGFIGSASEAVLFSVLRPNATYGVVLDTGSLDPVAVTPKANSGFTISFGIIVQTTTVYWSVFGT